MKRLLVLFLAVGMSVTFCVGNTKASAEECIATLVAYLPPTSPKECSQIKPAKFSKQYWDGTFQMNIEDSTGWGITSLAFYKDSSGKSKYGYSIGARSKFVIMSEPNSSGYMKVVYKKDGKNHTGYVLSKYVMINLPDVLPCIEYNIANISGAKSHLHSSSTGKDVSIPGTTGKNLYGNSLITSGGCTGKVYNSKLGYKEYIVPVMYPTAVKIAKAEKKLIAKGYNLKIYDAFRPNVISKYTYNNVYKYVSGKNTTQFFGSTYGINWFMANSVSSHNYGVALDVTLTNWSTRKEVSMPTDMLELSYRAVKYASPYTKNAKSGYASGMTTAAKEMNSVFIDCGMSTLASEWWHFQDDTEKSVVSGYWSNVSSWYPNTLAKR